MAWLTGGCPASQQMVVPHTHHPAKEQNSKLKVQFPINSYCFHKSVMSKNHKSKHHTLGNVLLPLFGVLFMDLRSLCFKNIKFGITCLLPMDTWLHLNSLTRLQIHPTYSYLQLWCTHIHICLSTLLILSLPTVITQNMRQLNLAKCYHGIILGTLREPSQLQEWFPCTTAFFKKIKWLTYLSAPGLSCGTQELWNALLHVESLAAVCGV